MHVAILEGARIHMTTKQKQYILRQKYCARLYIYLVAVGEHLQD